MEGPDDERLWSVSREKSPAWEADPPKRATYVIAHIV